MRRRQALSVLTSLAVIPIAAGAAPAIPPVIPGNTDRGYPSGGVLEIVAEFMGPGPSGVAVASGDRIFVSFPRHADNHTGATLAEVVDGKLTPFPDAAMSMPSEAPPRDRILSAHGSGFDTQGRLWVIDNGKLAGHPIPDGGAKVLGFDIDTRKLVASIPLLPPVLLPDSHMNDLRVDLTHGAAGTVFVTDSSFGTSPAFVVVDIARTPYATRARKVSPTGWRMTRLGAFTRPTSSTTQS